MSAHDFISSALQNCPMLSVEENRQLGMAFVALQDDVAETLAQLMYPVERLVMELRAGRRSFHRESPQEKKQGRRKAGITQTHAALIETKLGEFRDGRTNEAEAKVWLRGFLQGFTFDVLEDIVVFSTHYPVGEGNAGKHLRARLAEGMHDARGIRDRLVAGNYRLVLHEINDPAVQRQLRGHGRVGPDDLFSVGMTEGLTKAVNRYNPAEGTALSTMAKLWIQQAVGRHLKEHRYLYHIPLALQEKLSRDASPNGEGVAKKGCNAHVVLPVEASIHQQIGDESEATLGDVIADDGAEMPHEVTELRELQSMVANQVALLDAPSKLVLALRFGLGDPAGLARAIYTQEAAASDARSQKVVEQACRGLGSVAVIKVQEGKPVPARLLG